MADGRERKREHEFANSRLSLKSPGPEPSRAYYHRLDSSTVSVYFTSALNLIHATRLQQCTQSSAKWLLSLDPCAAVTSTYLSSLLLLLLFILLFDCMLL